MRLLVLGAGATGGYFGGRLAQAGADVTFLVRPARAAALARDGLVVKSRFGDLALPVRSVDQAHLAPDYDAVLFTCKAWDLEAAMADIAPAVGAGTLIVPLLNGLAHLPALDARFGAARVAGGLCHIAAMLSPEGQVLHLNELHSMTVGARGPGQAAPLDALAAAAAGAVFDFRLSPAIEAEMWQKFVFLATLAAATCLMRAAVGDIAATRDGRRIVAALFETCCATAAAAGFAPPAAWRDKTLGFLTLPGSTLTASMLRDLEAGGRTEADHILGDMLARAEAAGVDATLLAAAHCHLQSAAARRRREAGA